VSETAPRLDLRPDHWAIVRRILRRHVPDRKVLAFGSRATWTAKDYSDLDLAILGDEPLPLDAMSALAEGFRESDLPFKVDLVDWARVDDTLRDVIRHEGVEVLVSANTLATTCRFHPASGPVDSMSSREEPTTGGRPASDEWCEATLGDVITLKRGYDLPQRERMHGPIPVVSSSGITDHHSECRVSGPGVVIGRYGTLGKVFFIPGDFWPLNTSLYVQDFKGNDPQFISYFLRSLNFSAYSDKAAVPGLNRNHLHQEAVRIPARIEDQCAIAHVLGTLDDKIELNRRMNQTLEAMARAIFKDWFVDFGPVRAKMEEREPYLPPEIWGLFPDALDEEGKPVGWQTYTLSDLAHHHRATVSPSAEPDRIFEHYSIPAYDAANEPSLDSGGSIKSNKTIVVEGAVLLSKLNPEIERVWLPNPKRQALQVASTEFLALTPLPPATRSILYCLFRSPDLRGEMAAMVTGTSKSHQRVPPKALLARELLIADPQLLGSFDQMVLPFFDRLLSNRREARTLAQTRDLLLPKLMSGGMRPPDVERVVKAVA
jgi:type I restriction enzyme S subunit